MSVSAVARVLDTAALVGVRPRRRGLRELAGVISEAAKGGRLWLATSAVAAAVPRLRPAARDGLCGWGAASAAAFAVKAATDRRRPALAGAGSRPRSSSMPSSHTAGAVAYVVGAGLQSPALGAGLLPVAGAVAWSRAATARHFPTDVAAGAALGLLVGVVVHQVARVAQVHQPAADGDGAGTADRPSLEPKMAVASPSEAS